ncbi:NAD(P)/FAD-dependent oxidoreductase [Lutimonas sp.]|jgi:flavin-dependent dehydrogenase|uniref:NAD(P)/FAD-dependent oxidoreductase n=1 Tax=Lutimonas sp. TaxID=1872403 RepID=UPI003C722CF2
MSLKHVIVVGGGLAGLTTALHLSRFGIRVTLIEKNSYPRHKVCGEYLSNEVLPYLRSLGFDPFDFGAKKIERFELSSVKGKAVSVKLPLGGFSLSRYTLDQAMLNQAIAQGVSFVNDAVLDIKFTNDRFQVILKETGKLEGTFVIGSFGKRSNLDQKLKRDFLNSKAPYLAVKEHYSVDYPENLVGLYHFYGGYCGISKIENDLVNICYIAQYDEFKKYKNINDFKDKVLCKNKALEVIFKEATSTFEKPLSISQISFASKPVVEDHILMCGDSAGMIHPLCGNGMSMAIQGAKMSSELIIQYFNEEISRIEVEEMYRKKWNKAFGLRIATGRLLAGLFTMKSMALYVMNSGKNFPGLVRRIISMTHGKLIESI